jgi:hypothetical protein
MPGNLALRAGLRDVAETAMATDMKRGEMRAAKPRGPGS